MGREHAERAFLKLAADEEIEKRAQMRALELIGELEKAAQGEDLVAPHMDKARLQRRLTPGQDKTMWGGLLGGAGLGAAGGGALGWKMVGNKWLKPVGAAMGMMPGALAGSVPGLAVGSLLAGKPRGRLLTEGEARNRAIESALEQYSQEITDQGIDPYTSPDKLTPEQRARHQQVEDLEREYYRSTGRMPY